MHVCDRFSFSGRKVWKLPGNCVKGNRESWLSWDDSVFQNVVGEQAPKGSWSVLNTLCSNMTFRALTPGTKYTFFKLLSPWLGTYCHLVRESTRPVKNVLGIYWQFHSRKLSLVNISVEELKVLDWHLIVFQKDSHCHNRKRNMYIRDHWLGSTKREPISAQYPMSFVSLAEFYIGDELSVRERRQRRDYISETGNSSHEYLV